MENKIQLNKKEIRHIRRLAFSKKNIFDNEMVSILDENKEYLFLKNPITQNIYKYLIDYLCSFSKKMVW